MLFKQSKSLLTVSVDGKEICRINESELPIEKKPIIEIKKKGCEIVFEGSEGFKISHFLGEETGWFGFSIRVHQNLACQADCIFGKDKDLTTEKFAQGQLSGIRIQPFFLGKARAKEGELKGRGLFYRGLHFPGTITPGNVSLSCICDVCGRSFRLQSFHAGFDQSGYMYSDSGRFTIAIPGFVEGAPPALGKADEKKLRDLESMLPKAPDGTSFRYMNPLRCPHCSEPFINFELFPKDREIEYYGNTFYNQPAIHFTKNRG